MFSLPPFQSTSEGCGARRVTFSRASASTSPSGAAPPPGRRRRRTGSPARPCRPRSSHSVVEVVGLVDAAAPDPQQVHVRVERLVEPAREPVARDAGQEVVVGDPVGALDEDRPAVDDEGEGGARPRRPRCPARRCGSRCGAPRSRAPVEVDSATSSVVQRLARRSRAATTGRGPRRRPRRRHDDVVRRATVAGDAARSPSVTVTASARGVRPEAGALDLDVHRDAWPSPSIVTSGRTDASRAVRQRSSRTGFQMPAVCRSGPQSQPKVHAILRTMLNGCG